MDWAGVQWMRVISLSGRPVRTGPRAPCRFRPRRFDVDDIADDPDIRNGIERHEADGIGHLGSPSRSGGRPPCKCRACRAVRPRPIPFDRPALAAGDARRPAIGSAVAAFLDLEFAFARAFPERRKDGIAQIRNRDLLSRLLIKHSCLPKPRSFRRRVVPIRSLRSVAHSRPGVGRIRRAAGARLRRRD